MQSSRTEPFVYYGRDEILITENEEEINAAKARDRKEREKYLLICTLIVFAPFILIVLGGSLLVFLFLVRLFP